MTWFAQLSNWSKSLRLMNVFVSLLNVQKLAGSHRLSAGLQSVYIWTLLAVVVGGRPLSRESPPSAHRRSAGALPLAESAYAIAG